MKPSIKAFSLILVMGSGAIIAIVGAISIYASKALILGNLPQFLSWWADWIAWVLAIVLIISIQVGECRPIYLRHLHTSTRDLFHQGAHPGNASPDLKDLRTQLSEELGINRQKFLWAKAFAIGITIFDFVWSCLVFPPFRAGKDFAAIWSDLLRYGVGALDYFHVLMIAANIAFIPVCYLILLNEWSILLSGRRDVSHAK